MFSESFKGFGVVEKISIFWAGYLDNGVTENFGNYRGGCGFLFCFWLLVSCLVKILDFLSLGKS